MGMIRSLAAASRFHRIDGDYQVPRIKRGMIWENMTALKLPANAVSTKCAWDMGWGEVTKDKIYWVYILAGTIGGTLYIGVTNDLVGRVYDHRTGKVPGFTTRYHVHRLV